MAVTRIDWEMAVAFFLGVRGCLRNLFKFTLWAKSNREHLSFAAKDRELNNLHKFVGCPARPFWTGGTPIPQEPSKL